MSREDELEEDIEDMVMENVKLRKRIEELEDVLTSSMNEKHFNAVKEILERWNRAKE